MQGCRELLHIDPEATHFAQDALRYSDVSVDLYTSIHKLPILPRTRPDIVMSPLILSPLILPGWLLFLPPFVGIALDSRRWTFVILSHLLGMARIVG